MINVSENVKRAFYNDNTKKEIRIVFPNGEHPTITNESIVADSLQLTESLSSEEDLQYCVADASVFRIDAVCGDVTDCIIEVFVDVTFENEMSTVKLGKFKITACTKESNSNKRSIEAYSDRANGSLGVNPIEDFKRRQYVRTNQPYILYLNPTIDMMINKNDYDWKSAYYGGAKTFTINRINALGNILDKIEVTIRRQHILGICRTNLDETPKSTMRLLTNMLNDFNSNTANRRHTSDKSFDLYFYQQFIKNYYFEPFMYCCEYDNNSEIIFNCAGIEDKKTMFTNISSATEVGLGYIESIKYLKPSGSYWMETTYQLHDYTKCHFEEPYNYIRDDSHIVHIPREETQVEIGGKTYTFYKVNQEKNPTETERDMLNEYCANALVFIKYDRDGEIVFLNNVGNGTNPRFPTDTIYPSSNIYPEAPVDFQGYSKSMYRELSYADYLPDDYGYARIKVRDSEDKICKTTIKIMNGENVYDLSDLDFLSSVGVPTYSKDNEYFLKNIIMERYQFWTGAALKSRNIELVAKGLPYVEIGDTIEIIINNETIRTTVIKRTLSGEQNMIDHIEVQINKRHSKADEWIANVGVLEEVR